MGFMDSFKAAYDMGRNWRASQDIEDLEYEEPTFKDTGLVNQDNAQRAKDLGGSISDPSLREIMRQNAEFGADGAEADRMTAEGLNYASGYKGRANEGLSGAKQWSYAGETFDSKPSPNQKAYAESRRRAEIFDKYGLNDKADETRKQGLSDYMNDNIDKWRQKKIFRDELENQTMLEEQPYKIESTRQTARKQKLDNDTTERLQPYTDAQTKNSAVDSAVNTTENVMTLPDKIASSRLGVTKAMVDTQGQQILNTQRMLVANDKSLDLDMKGKLHTSLNVMDNIMKGDFDTINMPEAQGFMRNVAAVYNDPKHTDSNDGQELVFSGTRGGWQLRTQDGQLVPAQVALNTLYNEDPGRFMDVMQNAQMFDAARITGNIKDLYATKKTKAEAANLQKPKPLTKDQLIALMAQTDPTNPMLSFLLGDGAFDDQSFTDQTRLNAVLEAHKKRQSGLRP